MTARPPPARLLTELLADEAGALERLHYRVVAAAGLVAAGRQQFLAAAADEITVAIDHLGELELARAVVAAEVGAVWELPGDDPSLADLADAAPPAWRPTLEAFASRLADLVAAIDAAAAQGHRFASTGVERVRRNLAAFGTPASGYDAGGSPAGWASSGLAGRTA